MSHDMSCLVFVFSLSSRPLLFSSLVTQHIVIILSPHRHQLWPNTLSSNLSPTHSHHIITNQLVLTDSLWPTWHFLRMVGAPLRTPCGALCRRGTSDAPHAFSAAGVALSALRCLDTAAICAALIIVLVFCWWFCCAGDFALVILLIVMILLSCLWFCCAGDFVLLILIWYFAAGDLSCLWF